MTAGLEPRLPSVSVLELGHVSVHQKYIFDQPGLNMIYLKKKKYSFLQQTIDPSHRYLTVTQNTRIFLDHEVMGHIAFLNVFNVIIKFAFFSKAANDIGYSFHIFSVSFYVNLAALQ